MPKPSAIASAPTNGMTIAKMPNRIEATPLSMSSHSPVMYFRNRTAAISSSDPVTSDYAASTVLGEKLFARVSFFA